MLPTHPFLFTCVSTRNFLTNLFQWGQTSFHILGHFRAYPNSDCRVLCHTIPLDSSKMSYSDARGR